MSFSNSTASTIEAFAAALAVPLSPGPDGSVSFVFERSGTLSFTPSTDRRRVLISLAANAAGSTADMAHRALERAGLDPTTNLFVHAGLAADGSIVFAMSLEEEQLDQPVIENCLQRLIAQHGLLV
jgi:type III secretion system chaperone SycN